LNWIDVVIILSATTYDGSTATVTGERFKGDGYYGRADGLHTVAWKITGFVGTIKMQGSLSTDPGSSDWFDLELGSTTASFSIDTTGSASQQNISSVVYSTATTATAAYNFTGNFMWVRVVVDNFSAGTVNSVYMNN
jgi:hypothetical protein